MSEHPHDHDNTTTTHPGPNPTSGPSPLLCPVCWGAFTRVGRQRYCTDACRKTPWTRRHATTLTVAVTAVAKTVVPQAIRRRDITIYACPTCETRYHGEQWCHDCNQPCTRVGLGGLCPHCSEPVAHTDLIDTPAAATNR